MLYPQSENSVFYNPVQVQNRDLSVLMIGMYAERRAERLWVARKRKEVRRHLISEREKQEQTMESKEERKAKLLQLEEDINVRVRQEKNSVDFTKPTKESSYNSDGMSILEALAASGLRSLRYWKEVPGVRTIVINDLDPVAVDMARENVVRNGFLKDLVDDCGAIANKEDEEENEQTKQDEDVATSNERKSENNDKTTTNVEPLMAHHRRPRGIHLQCGDATHEMYLSRLPPTLYPNQCNPTQLRHQKPQYTVIDLDPYGSASPFLDAAVQSIVDGGLLAVTCTDMAALGGSHPETCYGRYGAFPMQRSGYLQELALRILLYHLSCVAGRYGRTIRPILSVGMAFYVRVFVEVYDDKAGVSLHVGTCGA